MVFFTKQMIIIGLLKAFTLLYLQTKSQYPFQLFYNIYTIVSFYENGSIFLSISVPKRDTDGIKCLFTIKAIRKR
jgi:hypothetical protein